MELQEATRSLNAQVEKATDCPLVVTQDASIRTPSMLRMASDSCSLSWEHTMKTRTVKNTKGTVGKVIPYTAKIIKAGALLADTKTLLSHWDTATSVKANLARIRQENLFGKASRSRVEDILAIFRQRYLTDEDVAKALVVFVQNRLPAASLDRILFFHSARADRLLHDAVTELLLPLKTRGATDVDVLEVQRAIAKWVAQGKARGKAAVPSVTLDNDLIRLLLDARGRVIGLVDKATGRNHCAPLSGSFATIKKGGVTYRPSSCTYDGGKLALAFGKGGVTAEIKVGVKNRYFVFELAALSDPNVEEAVIGGLAVDLSKDMSASVAWASDGEFAAAIVPLNLQVEVGLSGGPCPAFSPKCVRRYGLQGAKIALAGCPTRQVREVLKEVVRAEGLPYSPLGGPFALNAEENRGSYLFATVSEKDVDEWIEMGRRGGFAEIHLCPWWRGLATTSPIPVCTLTVLPA